MSVKGTATEANVAGMVSEGKSRKGERPKK